MRIYGESSANGLISTIFRFVTCESLQVSEKQRFPAEFPLNVRKDSTVAPSEALLTPNMGMSPKE